MITRIQIKNFKSLKEVDTEISNLNLLMGINGMGKSSFLQSLLLLVQSEKLEDGVIDLNGLLANIGQGRDALYQFAEEDNIQFELTFENHPKLTWDIAYQKEKEKLNSKSGVGKDQIDFFRENTKLFQYITAERIGPRDIYEASSVVVADRKQVGLLGEYAAYYINVFGQEYIVPEGLRHPQGSSSNLLSQVNAWMKEVSPGVSLNTKYMPEVNRVVLDYQFDLIDEKTISFRPRNVGFGISYVLPVILALLTAEKGKIIVIENPESHIHPRGQAELGRLISLAANMGAQLFIETHSDHILNGIRVAVKDEVINKSNVNVMYFDKITTEKEQYTEITQIRIDRKGELSAYPKNMIDEWGNQLFKLM